MLSVASVYEPGPGLRALDEGQYTLDPGATGAMRATLLANALDRG
jgi:hypothetical protein